METKTNEGGNVTIVVTPIDISPQSKEWKFDVGMNTHVVELDQDMLKIASLVDENGREYKPLNWDGPIGGHHREGILTFKPITSPYKIIQLKIAGVGGVIRVFTW